MNQQLKDRFLDGLEVEVKLVGALLDMARWKWVPEESRTDINHYRDAQLAVWQRLINEQYRNEAWMAQASFMDLARLSRDFMELKKNIHLTRKALLRSHEQFGSPAMAIDSVNRMCSEIAYKLSMTPNEKAQTLFEEATLQREVYLQTNKYEEIRQAAFKLKEAEKHLLGL